MAFQNEFLESNKPSCFGMPSCRSVGSDMCNSCVFNEQCDENCIAILKSMHDSIDVVALINKHQMLLIKARQERPTTSKTKIVIDNEIQQHKNEPIDKAEVVEFSVSDEDLKVIRRLSEREQKIAIKLCKQNLINQIKDDVKLKRNALDGFEFEWLRLALQCLIDDEFDGKMMVKKFIDILNISERTAVNYIHSSAVIFIKFKIAVHTETQHIIKVNPILLGGNYD